MSTPNSDAVFTALTALRLPHAAQRWANQQAMTTGGTLEERLGDLLASELDGRAARQQDRRATHARLPMPSACVEDLWAYPKRCIPPLTLSQLSTASWVKAGQHVAITGKTGRGKTWLACAFAQSALRAGLTVAYWDVPDLLAEWEAAEVAGGLHRLRRLLDRTDLLIIDDWAVEALDAARDVPALRRILLERLAKKSVLLVSPEPQEAWRGWLGDGYVADGLMDRFCHAAHSIHLQGPSLRR